MAFLSFLLTVAKLCFGLIYLLQFAVIYYIIDWNEKFRIYVKMIPRVICLILIIMYSVWLLGFTFLLPLLFVDVETLQQNLSVIIDAYIAKVGSGSHNK